MLLEGKIDEIVDLLIEGTPYREIAAKYGVPLSTLARFLARPENVAASNEGLRLSADQYTDQAEDVLKKAPSDSVEISRARELAQHYRWKASKRNPRRYGDKVDLTTDGQKINQPLDLSKYTDDELRTLAELQRKSGAGEA